uniref:Protein krueppel n=1 Tax=Anopheles culicifacies TaxID=139723 RepID=A0A182MR09_9DIPT
MDNFLDFRVICCTCLNVTHSTTSIQHKDLKHNVTLVEMINKICSIQFEIKEDYPDKLCYTCADKLRIAYEFRLMCDDSRNILFNRLESTNHPSPLQNTQPEAEVFTREGKQAAEDASNDITEYVQEVEYLEEYLQDESADEEITAPLKECTNNAENTIDSPTCFSEDRIKYEAIIEEPNATDENNVFSEIDNVVGETEENENQCTICGVVLSKLAHLRRHMKCHSASKPYRCTQCPKAFSRSDNLRAHEANHSSERKYKCPQCDKCFKHTYAMKVHMGVQHKEFVQMNFLVCTICSKFFKTKEQLNVHIKKHQVRNQFVCFMCGKTFVERFPYETHLEKHTNTEPFNCFHCSKQFASKTQLMLHTRYHSAEKTFKCKYCDTSFARKRDLKTHEDYHTGTKDHTCKTCGKSFHRLCALKTHMMTHTEERPYPCSYCPKRFRQKYDMITHERRHTGERFQCDKCVEQFIHAHQLNSHLKVVHNCEVQCRKRGVTKIFDEPSYQSGNSSEKNAQNEKC